MTSKHKVKQTEIGKIPKEWEVVRLGDISLDLLGGGTPSTSNQRFWNGNISWMTSAHINGKDITTGQKYITEDGLENSASNLVPRNNLLIATRVGIGKVAVNKIDIAISQDLTGVIIDRNKVLSDFLYWNLSTRKRKLKSLAQGSTIKGILKEDVGKLILPLPPLPEQQKIAEILSTADEAIQRVDEAIEKTQRLKQGLMRNLLTKGIGHRKFRKNEIGRMPTEWGKIKLGEVASVRYGFGQPPELDDSGVPMIRATNIKRGAIIRTGLVYIKRSAIPNSRNPFLKEGEIIVVRSGAYTGDSALITKEWAGAVAGYDLIVTPSSDINSQFLAYYLLSDTIQKYFSGQSVRSAQQHLNSQQVEETPTILPSISEQQEIADILGSIDEKLDLLKEKKERFKKIKQGLMNDLLTGKKRVKVS